MGKGKTYKIYVGKINRKKYNSSIGNFTTELSEKVRNSKNNNSINYNIIINFSNELHNY